MPLSEHEKKALDELSREIDAHDPKFARALGPHPGYRRPTRRMLLGTLVALAGLGLLLLGVSLEVLAVSVSGFLVMVFGANYGWDVKNQSTNHDSE